MNYIAKSINLLVLLLFIVLISFAPGNSAEIDDSTVFIDAFNAYQQKDYLLVIEKCDQLNQVFPDSPLRDVTLLLIARASLKSGDNERAAKSVALFSTEFPESSLKTSVEDELKVLANRHQKGEVLGADKTLQIAAGKVRSDTLARERAAKLKLETECAATARTEQERLLAEKLDWANLTIRLQLPSQVDFQGAPDVSFKQEPNGTLVFTVDHIEAGKLAEINLDVKVREVSAIGQELRGNVEVVHGSLQRKDIFTASASKVQAK